MEPDESNPSRRAFLAGLLALPAIGTIADVAIRASRKAETRHAARIPARAHLIDPAEHRQLPTERLIEIAWSEREER